MKSILDPSFRYIPSAQTDIRKTFARVRREQRRQEVERQAEQITQHAILRLPLKAKEGAR